MAEQKPDQKPQVPPPPPRQPDETLKGYIERGNKPAPSQATEDSRDRE